MSDPQSLSLPRLLLDRANDEDWSHRPIIVSAINNSRSLSLSELCIYVKSLALGIQKRGLRPGDRVIVLPNMAEAYIHDVVVFLAVIAAGGIYAGFDTGRGPSEVTQGLKDVESHFLITGTTSLDVVQTCLDRLSFPTQNVFINDDSFDHFPRKTPPIPGATWLADLVDIDAHTEFQFPEPSLHETASLFWTSGTSGRIKAAELTQQNLLAGIDILSTEYEAWAASMEKHNGVVHPEMRILSLYSLAHVSGTRILRAIYAASPDRPIRYSPLAHAQVRDVLKVASGIQATHILTPSHLLSELIDFALKVENDTSLLHGIDLSRLNSVTVSGSPCPRALSEKAPAILYRCGAKENALEIKNHWGLTETTGVITQMSRSIISNLSDHFVGVLYPGMEARISHGIEQADSPHLKGDIEVRGPLVFKQYWRNPKATSAIFTPDGWLRTGDIGMIIPADDAKESGGRPSVHVPGRASENFKYLGRSVSPAEIESVILQHPRVSDAAVVGTPDPADKEQTVIPWAFVVGNVTADQVEEYLDREIAKELQMKGRINVVSQIPKVANQKTDKRALVESIGRENG